MDEKKFMLKLDGFKLKDLRNRKKLSQTKLGAKIGLTYMAVSKYELNKVESPSMDMIQAFAKALGCRMEDICVETEGEGQGNTPRALGELSPELTKIVQELLNLPESDRQTVFQCVKSVLILTGKPRPVQ